jgi:hypothetical protein
MREHRAREDYGFEATALRNALGMLERRRAAQQG